VLKEILLGRSFSSSPKRTSSFLVAKVKDDLGDPPFLIERMKHPCPSRKHKIAS
jgi:hypothetical protein